MKPKIPIVYLEVIERFYNNRAGYDNRVRCNRAKYILGVTYHFPKRIIRQVLQEMQDFGLLRCSQQWIYILWKPEKDN